MFTPSVDVKEELKNTAIQITCLDEDGNVLKRVTSGDSGDIEDPDTPSGGNDGSSSSQSGNQGGNTGGGGNPDDDEPGGSDH